VNTIDDILADLNEQSLALYGMELTADQCALISEPDHYSNDALGMLNDMEARIGLDVDAAREWILRAMAGVDDSGDLSGKRDDVSEPELTAQLLDVLTDHIASLEGCNFGSDVAISGADAIDAVNAHFEQLRDLLARINGSK